jgi:hypothetical protein
VIDLATILYALRALRGRPFDLSDRGTTGAVDDAHAHAPAGSVPAEAE